MRPRSIRIRLTLWYTLFFLILMASMGSLVLWRVHSHLVENADVSLKEEIEELFEEITAVAKQDDLVEILKQRFSNHSHYHFEVRNERLEKVFVSPFLTHLELPSAEFPGEMRGANFSDIELAGLGHYRLLDMAVRDHHSQPILLRAISPRLLIDRDFRGYIWMFATLGPVAILAALVAGYLVAGHLLSPIKKIIAKAKSISADRLDERLPIVHAFDELGELSQTLNAAFDRLERTVETMRRFTSDAAHELRSPVAALRTEAEIALRKPRSNEEYKAVVETTLAETIRLGELVDQLLTLSRHDAGVEERLTDEVPVGALLLDVVSRFQAVAKAKGVNIVATSIQECLVNGHDVQLSQLFFNLIDNAVKFTPAGGRVEVSMGLAMKEALISVRDTGIGIESEKLPKVFERFFRADNAREHHRGTGLGLSICKSIVDVHGGTIKVVSQEGQGTTFFVKLPFIDQVDEPANETNKRLSDDLTAAAGI